MHLAVIIGNQRWVYLPKSNIAATVILPSGRISRRLRSNFKSVKEIRGAKSHEGETVDFRVVRDVVVDGVVAIPAGTIAKGSVYEAKSSTAFGTRGRLGVKIKYLNTPSGDVVNFTSSDIYIKGSNRTAVSVVVFCFLKSATDI